MIQIDSQKSAYALRTLGVCIWSGAIVTWFQQAQSIWIPSIIFGVFFVISFRFGFGGNPLLEEKLSVVLEKKYLHGMYSLRDFFADMTISLCGSFTLVIIGLLHISPTLLSVVCFCIASLCILISGCFKN